MQIDLGRLRQNVIDYINDPAAKNELASQQNSILFNFIVTLLFIPIGLILICTIFLAPIGWPMMAGGFMSIVTGNVFELPIKNLQKKAKDLKVFVASPVMVGPEGFGLILFSESPQSASQPDYLAKKAKLMFRFYSGTHVASTPEDRSLVRLLKEDDYVPSRIRQVPATHSDGQRLLLMDTEINSRYVVGDSGGNQVVLCVWVPTIEVEDDKPRGYVLYLPWQLAASAAVKSV